MNINCLRSLCSLSKKLPVTKTSDCSLQVGVVITNETVNNHNTSNYSSCTVKEKSQFHGGTEKMKRDVLKSERAAFSTSCQNESFTSVILF